MQLPIEISHPTTHTPLKKLGQISLAPLFMLWHGIKEAIKSPYEFEHFYVHPQMPRQQISHCVKKAITLNQPVIIQVNELDDVVSEIIGYPYISLDSSHLILKSFKQDTSYVIKGPSIRHIRQLYHDAI
ncbi:hypothetical protein [Dolosigranulum savutiense]|uniref:Uncharacterized protein n=1 Tax=Dolosigranulum savutiense TaxID=3110288 RepID=A0AB74U482_9LACT